MKNCNYVAELVELTKAEKVIRKAIDTYNVNRKQRDYLFKQLDVVGEKKKAVYFKIELSERLRSDEKSRKSF